MWASLESLAAWEKASLYFAGSVAALFVYGFALAVYRLTFHPLAQFPGPKFTAATGWYEFFVEIFQGPRKTFAFQIETMHQKYGPIVRINPHEIHVNDPDFFARLYATSNGKRDKYAPAASVLGMPTGVFGTESHGLHRIRRAAIESLFSTKNVTTHYDMLQSKADLLCEQFHAASLHGEPLDIRFALLAYTTDCFEAHVLQESERMDLLKDAKKSGVWRDSIVAVLHWTRVVRQFPWAIGVAKRIPVWILQRPFPEMAYILSRFREMCAYAENAIVEWNNGSDKGRGQHLWQTILSSDLVPSDKSAWRMAEEAMTLLTASGDTGARTLTVAMYHLHANPTYLQQLREELKSVMIKATDDVEFTTLESLPWLSATIEESLRISSLITSRQPVLAREETLQYKSWAIPPGTPVGMTLSSLMMNDIVYSSPYTFSPERWLQSNHETPRNRKYFYPFHRGHRMCIARNLALPEVFLCLAKLVRRFECELFDVIRERDIDHHRDCFLGEPRDDTKGVRVRVLKDLRDDETS